MGNLEKIMEHIWESMEMTRKIASSLLHVTPLSQDMVNILFTLDHVTLAGLTCETISGFNHVRMSQKTVHFSDSSVHKQ